ncbi:sensor histidine kinase [Gottfriedia sp. NPDC056225]|uniref:sensor histidine kinase n=1 Tax=Gottfriedia sp. NPDC056225 TaxID=3345751 RepID=UPI0035DEAD56
MKEKNNFLLRPIIGAVIILVFMSTGKLFSGPPLKTALYFAIWATLTCILLIPKYKWSNITLVIAFCIMAIETSIGLILFKEINVLYFLAFMFHVTIIRSSLSRTPIASIIVMIIIALIYTRFGHQDLLSVLTYILISIIIYLNVKSRMQRNEMYNLNKQHLVNLEKAYSQLQEASSTVMQNAILEERNRIAREIHDAVGHSLTSLIVQMQALQYMIKKDPNQAEQSLKDMLVVARKGLEDIRKSVHSLADEIPQSAVGTLETLLTHMESSTSIQYSFQAEIGDVELDVEVYKILFRILQESITNVIRHSKATKLDVLLRTESECINMTIRDNGYLDHAQNISEGFGLKSMRERLEKMHGSLSYSVNTPHGFEIVAKIPL